jgi:hypothetical protein
MPKGASKVTLKPQTTDSRSTDKENLLPGDPAGEKTAGEKKPRPRNPLFDAVAEVCAADPATAGSLIGKVCTALSGAEPPYTPEDVREFARRFLELCPWARDGGRTRPEPAELQKHIGKIRASPAPRPAEPVLTRPAFDW